MPKDKKGYFYFVDRIGDTFRWKSENVATSEVSEVSEVTKELDKTTETKIIYPKKKPLVVQKVLIKQLLNQVYFQKVIIR